MLAPLGNLVPELPEVEVVRRGVHSWLIGRTVEAVEVRHPRSIRRHLAGETDFKQRLQGVTVNGSGRRGKYLWLTLDSSDVLVLHLGMSGQLRVQELDTADEAHLRVRFRFVDSARELRFVDQRTFGSLALDEPDPTSGVPSKLAHIARDPFDPAFDIGMTVASFRRTSRPIKSVLLDQTVISGVGNIYADESLWRARLHWARPADRVPASRLRELLNHAKEVMIEAVSAGGTSFDSLYVNVNGASGYFARRLQAYGREGEACARCGSVIIRESYTNRSSFRCVRCQPSARNAPRRVVGNVMLEVLDERGV